jgi:uncharacterized membrane protein (GlpM family)
MLILKAVIVPFFILIVTLAGRKWGHKVAGILAGFPIVAGPIVIFLALDQGTVFAQKVALAAINGVFALVIFTTVFCWACTRFHLVPSIFIATVTWLLGALIIQETSPGLIPAVLISAAALLISNFLLPRAKELSPKKTYFNDLTWRMMIGTIFTLAITTLASHLGPVWSGILAVFPAIFLVLTSFVFLVDGPSHVIEMCRGMLAGLGAFLIFFVVLASVWPSASILNASLMAIVFSLAAQLAVQFFLRVAKQKNMAKIK